MYYKNHYKASLVLNIVLKHSRYGPFELVGVLRVYFSAPLKEFKVEDVPWLHIGKAVGKKT